jgi:methyl-accepting chemotaxis protein
VGQVSQANKVVAEIAEGAQEQATGLREVNAAVSQMDQFTQQNAAMVEETTASSHGLKYDIEQLAHSLAKFDLGERVAEDASTRRGQDGLVKRSQPSPRAGRAVSSRGSAVALQTQSQPAEQNWEDF